MKFRGCAQIYSVIKLLLTVNSLQSLTTNLKNFQYVYILDIKKIIMALYILYLQLFLLF